ncbi:MAG: helix-turn-helix domain-containing protein [Rhodobacteraceae bacterium]|nr:helix-turn-helix domain-containing protein [Paracoccaceae bacterium]
MIRTVLLHPDPCQQSSLFIASEMLDTANRVARLHGKSAVFDPVIRRPGACETGADEAGADLVILPGLGLSSGREVRAAMETSAFKDLTQALRRLAGPRTLIAGACSGCFALGAAGLLDRRAVTTTWWLAPLLQSMFPRSRVKSGEIVLRDGPLITAGAAFSQIDLMLVLIEQSCGTAIAEDCRRFLMADSRPSQLPYMSVATLVAGDAALQKAELFLRQNIHRQVSLEELAVAAGLGTRTFSRRLSRQTALTPSAFAQTLRVTEAIRLARSTSLGHDQIAERVGYADATALRRTMRRRTGRTLESFRT